MGLWENIRSRLGLSDDWDDEYEDYEDEDDEYYDPGAEQASSRNMYDSSIGGSTSVRRIDRESDVERSRSGGRVEHLRSVPAAGSAEKPHVKMHIVEPKSYSEAQAIADKFKSGTPVIMNLTLTSPDLAKRLLDFASGLTYGLDGGLQKVSEKVFMLTPANVDVSAGDYRRFSDSSLFPRE